MIRVIVGSVLGAVIGFCASFVGFYCLSSGIGSNLQVEGCVMFALLSMFPTGLIGAIAGATDAITRELRSRFPREGDPPSGQPPA